VLLDGITPDSYAFGSAKRKKPASAPHMNPSQEVIPEVVHSREGESQRSTRAIIAANAASSIMRYLLIRGVGNDMRDLVYFMRQDLAEVRAPQRNVVGQFDFTR
jgi:hypothetical protein